MYTIDWPQTWLTLRAFLETGVLVVVILGVIYWVIQLREARLLRYAEVWDKIDGILSDPEVVQARAFVKARTNKDFDYDTVNEEERLNIELVTRSFDRAGFLVVKGLIPLEYVVSEWPGARWHWEMLKKYVVRQREVENYEARKHFEELAELTQRYRLKKGLSLKGYVPGGGVKKQ